MDDFARMPSQRKIAVFAVIGGLGALLYWQFGYKSLGRDLDDAEADHDSKLSMNGSLANDIPKYEALKTRMTALQHTLEEQEKALPTEAELPAFFETLNRKVLESGVEVKTSQREKEEKIETFVRVPVTFEITGTFMQIKKFFASLVSHKSKSSELDKKPGDNVEEHDRIVSIENLTLNDPQVINHELIMRAKFTALTYRQEAPLVAPSAVQGGAAASPGPGAGTGSAAKPLPPPDTPAGAKARAEGAMDKDDKRSRNAPTGSPADDNKGSAKLKGGQ